MYFCELSRAEGDVTDAYAHMKSISLGLEQALCRRLMPQYLIDCHRNSQRPQQNSTAYEMAHDDWVFVISFTSPLA